ncbi:unnamed protein product [Fraxinus pennsylvanica]|uniref:Uncharacterized protein n=1 Tax=Fraxinus pennsylvanica TaxID=56036 RepID=A0AAD2AEX7_9LAMI|nr:unnamed protein product [Fraxinus pennsylvanica]
MNTSLTYGEDARVVGIKELRGGEERKIPLYLGELGHVQLKFSYVDNEDEEPARTDEIVVGIADKGDRNDSTNDIPIRGRTSSVESYDPFMARRLAKHLHGYSP